MYFATLISYREPTFESEIETCIVSEPNFVGHMRVVPKPTLDVNMGIEVVF